ASVVPRRGAPARLAAYWAVTEDGHVSAVGAGENRGATLTHDGVVRAYRPVAAWLAEPGVAAELRYDLPHTSDPAHAPHLNLVILDASTGRPVQAVKLGC
ncbi:MAG: DUF1223 domain-containing protein, partial [Pseudomonadota bacterium]|nr:DUF1223 domain-containing protein [Pseudomonadota bacterium]